MIYDFQKASFIKRLSAGLFDGILVVVLAIGFALLIALISGYDDYSNEYDSRLEAFQNEYGVDFYAYTDNADQMTEEEKTHYMEAYNAFIGDEAAMKAYNMTVNLMLVMISIGVFLAITIIEFVMPLVFRNGQTLGKKIFGLAVVRTNCVRITTPALFIRTLLGKYSVETMIPVLIVMMMVMGNIGVVGPIVVLGILAVQLIMFNVTPTRSLIHDMLSDTAVVDFTSQMIFDSDESLMEYKKRIAAEKAAEETY